MSDKELIERYLNGDEFALEELLSRHLQGIYNICYNICLDKNDCEDISQEVCFKVIKNLKSFRFQSEFKTWLYKIAYNESINYVQKNKKTYQFDEKIDEGYIEKNTLNDEYLSTIITNEVNSLNTTDRNIIIMYYYENLSINEIAEITGMGVSNVKVRLHRTRETLKPKLEKYGIQELL